MSNALATLPPRSGGVQRVADIVGSLDEMWHLANILIKSRMLPQSIQSPEAAVAIMLKGRELGVGAMAAFAGITVIQGKPVVSPQMMLSLINRSGVLEDLKIEDDGDRCTVTMTRRGKSPIAASFSMKDARDMQLAGKDNWKKMPAVMRQWRAVAACSRVACPDVIDGMYTPEEMGAEVDDEGTIIDGEVMAEHRPVVEPAPQLAIEPAAQPGKWSKTNRHPNNGAAPDGRYCTEDQAKVYVRKLEARVDAINAQWSDHWGSTPGDIPDEAKAPLLNKYQADNHLLKWAVEIGEINPDALEKGAGQVRLLGRYLGILIHRSKALAQAVARELDEYAVKTFEAKKEAIYRKHPHLAPEGWQEEQDESGGDELGGATVAVAVAPGDPAPWEEGRE